MKKIFVLLISTLLVFSITLVSMGAPTIKGDFRYDMYDDESQDESKGKDQSYATADLRISVQDKLSDSLTAFAKFRARHQKNDDDTDFDINEYYVNYKESWGSVKAGYYEYKFTPSRVLLKSGYYHVWPKVDVMAATTFNTPVNGLAFDLMFQPYAQEEMDDGAYGLSTSYNADKWGIKLTYADLKKADEAVAEYNKIYNKGSADDADVFAFDIYYTPIKGMKFFVDAVDYSSNDESNAAIADSVFDDNGIDGLDPVLGFQWKAIGGSKLDFSLERALNPRFEDTDKEYDGSAIGAKYHLSKQTSIEFEHYVIGDDQTKNMLRLRYKF
ncbi:porin [Iocasia frigidifontis]|uniref:Porin n=1 Tax=Iocasia fonsfrigidae TaxID=2682810 RepID=A0A8A7KGL1_9FIRM|nr:porin [Iocasia fonsfrigidae]QTL97294.1 porin [Iocasia fonsfrigidae]